MSSYLLFPDLLLGRKEGRGKGGEKKGVGVNEGSPYSIFRRAQWEERERKGRGVRKRKEEGNLLPSYNVWEALRKKGKKGGGEERGRVFPSFCLTILKEKEGEGEEKKER